LQIIFNKGSVMVLPTGVSKASGLQRVLEEMHLSPDDLVGVGDAENDHAFLEKCAVGVVVNNALPALKERADFVTRGARGEGVTELIDLILNDQLASFAGDKSQD
ncbi:MAG TPA: HAD-IIB family hydrolase, partial [Chthoniobacterales bacterium]|nr:HAD-IIB family hydrolase [Chthoniobacterales bacterium]